MIRIGFVMEIGLGHTTFYHNVQQAVAAAPQIEPVWIPITFDTKDPLAYLPKVRNDIVLRGGLQASLKVRAALRRAPLDVLFFHTQMPAVFCQSLMKRIPSVISLDATPKQFLELGPWYGLTSDPNSALEQRRDRWYRRAFAASRRVIPWSQWAAQSLKGDYEVPAEKINVFFPGVDLTQWTPKVRAGGQETVRLLFVGGEFARKGGDLLLRWMQSAPPQVHLDVVTRDPIPVTHNVSVHRDLTAQDPRLRALYQEADIFVLPTHADCSPNVVLEAMASGLPVISTRVGALPELVVDGQTGYLMDAGDDAALAEQLECLTHRPEVRRAFGLAARARAETWFDGPRNLARELQAFCGLAANGKAD